MTRRAQQHARALRAAKRDHDNAVQSPSGTYRRPPHEDCIEKQWEMPYDDANSVQAQFITWRRRGALVDFVVNIQRLTADGWSTIEYYDCCHGFCHMHHANPKLQPLVVLRLDDAADVQTAMKKVHAQVADRMRIIRGKEGER